MKYSIIIPAYNSAGFIHRALDSVKAQTYTDYELIVVCDSCTDNTEEIAKSYGAKTFAVDFHQDGQTRNVGIEKAKGDYLLFMDDDDWWTKDTVIEEIDAAMGDADVLLIGFLWEHRGYCHPDYYYACWTKCYRREFVGDARFSNVPKWSDIDFFNRVMKKNPKIKRLDQCLYYYHFMREGSQSWSPY